MDRPTRIETIGDAEHAILALERRIAELESTVRVLSAPPVTQPAPGAMYAATAEVQPTVTTATLAPEPEPEPAKPTRDYSHLPGLLGRSFLVLAGAFLLRALTDAGTLSPTMGVAVGLGYAVLWLVMADLDGGKGHGLSAVFHGLVASMVAFPLVGEATIRLKVFTPETSAMVLGAFDAVALVVATRRSLRSVAWTVSMLTLAAATVFVPMTDRIVPYAVLLIGLGIATLWLGYLKNWIGLRWPIALAADCAVLGVTVRVAAGHAVESATAAAAMQLLLIGAYLLSIIVRTLVRGRDVLPFEIAQGITALAVGLGGAVILANYNMLGAGGVGMASLLLGTASYVAAFLFIAQRQGHKDNFYFYTTLGLLLVLAATTLLLDRTPLALTRVALALAAAYAAARFGPPLLSIHAAIFGLAAAITSSLLSTATTRVAPVSVENWTPFDAIMLVVMVSTGVCAAIPASPRARTWGPSSDIPRVGLLGLVTWGAAGWLVDVLAPLLASHGGHDLDPGIVATLRTCVIAMTSLVLAGIGRSESFREARWLVYPLLAFGGLKLLADDFPRSRPATMFVALAVYGFALIAAPKLARVRAAADPTPTSPPPPIPES